MTIETPVKSLMYLKLDSMDNSYAIPENEEFSFTLMVEEIQNAECGSQEWFRLMDELEENYGQYLKVE